MIEVKAADLIGAALDWAVAKADGVSVSLLPKDNPKEKWQVQRAGYPHGPYWPSQDWSQCGPLIEKHRLELIENEDGWAAVKGWIYGEIYQMYPVGETHLIAACRAIVADKLGGTVQVPSELME